VRRRSSSLKIAQDHSIASQDCSIASSCTRSIESSRVLDHTVRVCGDGEGRVRVTGKGAAKYGADNGHQGDVELWLWMGTLSTICFVWVAKLHPCHIRRVRGCVLTSCSYSCGVGREFSREALSTDLSVRHPRALPLAECVIMCCVSFWWAVEEGALF